MIIEKLKKEEWKELDLAGKVLQCRKVAEQYIGLYEEKKIGSLLRSAFAYYKRANSYFLAELGADKGARAKRHYDKMDFWQFLPLYVDKLEAIVKIEAELRELCEEHGYSFQPWSWINREYVSKTAYLSAFRNRADLN